MGQRCLAALKVSIPAISLESVFLVRLDVVNGYDLTTAYRFCRVTLDFIKYQFITMFHFNVVFAVFKGSNKYK
jgi:hypothetical protein